MEQRRAASWKTLAASADRAATGWGSCSSAASLAFSNSATNLGIHPLVVLHQQPCPAELLCSPTNCGRCRRAAVGVLLSSGLQCCGDRPVAALGQAGLWLLLGRRCMEGRQGAE